MSLPRLCTWPRDDTDHWRDAHERGLHRGHPRSFAKDLYASPRALEELGWAPRIPLEQSIADTLDYWRDRAHMEVD